MDAYVKLCRIVVGRTMYLHLTVLVVASAFPLVQILDPVGDKQHSNNTEELDFNDRHPRSTRSGDRNADVLRPKSRGASPSIAAEHYNTPVSTLMLRHRILKHRLRHGEDAPKTKKSLLIYNGLENVLQVRGDPENNKDLNDEEYGDEEDDMWDEGEFPSLDLHTMPRFGCLKFSGYEDKWIYAIQTCSPSWTDENTRQLCKKTHDSPMSPNNYDINMLPVQTVNGTVYKNRYCAVCNYALDHEHWKVEVTCDSPSNVVFTSGIRAIDILDNILYNDICRFKLIPSYESRVKACTPRSKRAPKEAYRPPQAINDAYPISFSVLMNFGFDGKTHILFTTTEQEKILKETKKCKDGEILDPGNNLCRQVTCSEGFTLQDEMCVRQDSNGTVEKTDINTISDFDQLTNLNRVALISLEVNVTNDDLGLALVALDFKPLMVKKFAQLLNISADRIQNFTTVFLNETHLHGYHIRVKTMTQDEFQHSKGVPGASGDFLQVVTEYKDTEYDKHIDSESVSSINDTKRENSQAKKRLNSDVNSNVTDEGLEVNANTTVEIPELFTEGGNATEHEAGSSNSSSGSSVNHKGHLIKPKHAILSPKVLQMSFILLPAKRKSTKSLSDVIMRMNTMLNQNTFKIDLNGTTLNIINVNDTVTSAKTTFCKFGTKLIYFDNEFKIIKINDDDHNTTKTNVYIPSTDTLYQPGEYDMTVLVEGNLGTKTNVTDVAGYVFVCINPRIIDRNCARITLATEEYTLYKNKSIKFSDTLYNMMEYDILDEERGTLEICVPDEYYNSNKQKETKQWIVHECYTGFEDFVIAEGYLTSVIGRLSIVALSSVLLTYCLFESLRNLPGMNTMNLTLALLIGEIMFIEGESSNTPWVCKMVAICVHYFFLASFFWMNVMAYDVYKTFATRCILVRVRKARTFLPRYALYAWGSPALIVAVCLAIELSNLKDLHIGYGESASVDIKYINQTESSEGFSVNNTVVRHLVHTEGCWIRNPVVAMVAFGAPMLVIFVINIVFFVRTIICIRATVKLAHVNTRRTFSRLTGKNTVMLYVRMSTVMGFTWCFGLASSLVSVVFQSTDQAVCLALHILSILFTLCMCAQGLFIFFAFVFKKRVFCLYRGLSRRLGVSLNAKRSTNLHTISNSSLDSNLTNISHISR